MTIGKRIPAAAGLGGASSDAAATLSSLRSHSGSPLTVVNECAQPELRPTAEAMCHSFCVPGSPSERDAASTLAAPILPVHAVIITPKSTSRTRPARCMPDWRRTDWTDGRQVATLAERLSTRRDYRYRSIYCRTLFDGPCMISSRTSARSPTRSSRCLAAACTSPARDLALRPLLRDAQNRAWCDDRLSAPIDPDRAHLHTVRSVSRALIAESPDV